MLDRELELLFEQEFELAEEYIFLLELACNLDLSSRSGM